MQCEVRISVLSVTLRNAIYSGTYVSARGKNGVGCRKGKGLNGRVEMEQDTRAATLSLQAICNCKRHNCSVKILYLKIIFDVLVSKLRCRCITL